MNGIRIAALAGLLLLAACANQPTDRSGQVVDRLPAAASSPPASARLGLDDIVNLAAAGQSGEAILGRLRETHTRLRLSASDVLSLKGRGVPLAVIDHLLDAERHAQADDCATQINQREVYARQVQEQAERACAQRCNQACPPVGGWFYYGSPHWRRWP